MAESTKLTLGLALTPRTRALFDGSVRPDGIQLHCESKFGDGLDNTGARHRAILSGAVDGGECSTSSLILARMRGKSLRGLPIFPARQFRHRCIFCSATSQAEPSSGAQRNARERPSLQRHECGLVARAARDEYGVTPDQMEWLWRSRTSERKRPHRRQSSVKVSFIPEPRTREHAIELVENGAIDAALEPYGSLSSNSKLRRLLKDHRKKKPNIFAALR